MKNIFVLIFLATFILIVFLTVRNLFRESSAKIISDSHKPTDAISAKVLADEINLVNDLSKIVDDAMNGANGTYAIFIKNLKTNESYSFNEHMKFKAGSLYKLWVMGEAYNEIKSNNLSLSDYLTEVSLTVGDALNQMVTVSDNSSAFALTNKLTAVNISSFMKKFNFSESDFGDETNEPMTTAYDVASFFEKLYKGEIVDSSSSSEMVELLKEQTLNDVIPKYLPSEIAIAHKTGDIDNFYHDAGIVYTKNGDYIIVLMSESDDPSQSAVRESVISKNVFDYFNSQRG
ncbi:MAG: serine hydrolase [Candidatus Woesebacteria bacterium]|nr:MAG: serine hydrolase [Candidatus Woesebacteria bacterium]